MHRDSRVKLWFVLPAALWVLCFTVFPLIYGVRLSLFNMEADGSLTYVGLRNYAQFFRDGRALSSATVTLIFVGCGVALQMALGMAVALLLSRPMPARGLLRTVLTLPLFATPIAVGLLFVTIFYEEGGLLNGLLHLVHVKIPWLSHPRWAVAAVILVDVWQWTPFCFLVFLAALQGIPEDYYEAARLETNSRWRVFRHITLPVLQPTIVLVLLLRITEAFKVFDIPYTLTQGGPGTATEVLTMFAYQAGMRFSNFGYSSAIAVVLFALVMVLIMTLFRRIRQVYQ